LSAADQAQVDAEITQLKNQIVSIAQNANFQGVNMLKTGGTAATIVIGYDKAAATPVATMAVAAYDLEAAAGTITDSATAETALTAMKAAAATIGAAKSRVDSQKAFTSKLMDSIDRGVGQLVDSDMEKESARLSALQVQQQLGIQSLSIANSNTQNILALFRG
jgi:flagellin